MQGPAKNRSTDFVVETSERQIGMVVATPLPTKNSQSLDENVETNSRSRCPPNNGITNEIDLTMVFAPKVDATAKDGP